MRVHTQVRTKAAPPFIASQVPAPTPHTLAALGAVFPTGIRASSLGTVPSAAAADSGGGGSGGIKLLAATASLLLPADARVTRIAAPPPALEAIRRAKGSGKHAARLRDARSAQASQLASDSDIHSAPETLLALDEEGLSSADDDVDATPTAVAGVKRRRNVGAGALAEAAKPISQVTSFSSLSEELDLEPWHFPAGSSDNGTTTDDGEGLADCYLPLRCAVLAPSAKRRAVIGPAGSTRPQAAAAAMSITPANRGEGATGHPAAATPAEATAHSTPTESTSLEESPKHSSAEAWRLLATSAAPILSTAPTTVGTSNLAAAGLRLPSFEFPLPALEAQLRLGSLEPLMHSSHAALASAAAFGSTNDGRTPSDCSIFVGSLRA